MSDEHIEPAKNQTLTQSFIKNNLVFECHRNVGALRGFHVAGTMPTLNTTMSKNMIITSAGGV